MKAIVVLPLLLLLAAMVEAVVIGRDGMPKVTLCSTHKRRSHKTVRLHDIARNDSRNEYFAGGQDDEGRGSCTVLLYPDEEDAANTTEAAEPEPVEKFTGSGRKL